MRVRCGVVWYGVGATRGHRGVGAHEVCMRRPQGTRAPGRARVPAACAAPTLKVCSRASRVAGARAEEQERMKRRGGGLAAGYSLGARARRICGGVTGMGGGVAPGVW